MPIKEIRDIIFSIFKFSSFKILSRQKIILGIALLLGLSALLYQSLVALQVTNSKAAGFYLSAQMKLATHQQKIMQDPQTLLAKIEEKWGRLNNLEKRFIPEQEEGEFFNSLKDLIGRTENHLVSLDIKPSVSMEASYDRLPFSLSVKGHYVDAILLLNKLEIHQQLIGINDIKIQPTPEKSSEVVMILEAESYVVKQ